MAPWWLNDCRAVAYQAVKIITGMEKSNVFRKPMEIFHLPVFSSILPVSVC